MSVALLDRLKAELSALSQEQQEQLVAKLDPTELALVDAALRRPSLQPHQVPPEGDWDVWLLLAGRGAGKSFASAHWFNEHMSGPPCDKRVPGGHRASIIAPTLGDAWESCVAGPSGLQSINPSVVGRSEKGGTVVVWPSGARARLFGAHGPDDVERLRAGGNRCAIWAEELAAWIRLEDSWHHADIGLRLGTHPRTVASTTPKPRRMIKKLLRDPLVAVTRARTDDNRFLHERVRAALYDRYSGTRLGRQELEGELIEDREGALFTTDNIDEHRVSDCPALRRLVIGLDPAVTSTEESDESGIIVAGVGSDMHGYVLEDRSLRGTPEQVMRQVVVAYHAHQANLVVIEKNNGGDYLPAVLAAVDPTVPWRLVSASRGKTIRAEPVSALYEQGRIHHVGTFLDLEEQMTSWAPEDPTSPDRLDALVWAFTDLIVGSSGTEAYYEGLAPLCPTCSIPVIRGVTPCPHCGTGLDGQEAEGQGAGQGLGPPFSF